MVGTRGRVAGTPWSETCRDRGGRAGGGTELLAPAALGHKAGDNAGDCVATSPAPFGWDGRAVAVLGMARRCAQQRWGGTGALWWVVALLGTALAMSEVAASRVGACTGAARQDAVGEQIPLALPAY